jgi:hypothetical protein
LEHQKIKNRPHPLFRTRTNHARHQKPNPFRETVTLKRAENKPKTLKKAEHIKAYILLKKTHSAGRTEHSTRSGTLPMDKQMALKLPRSVPCNEDV